MMILCTKISISSSHQSSCALYHDDEYDGDDDANYDDNYVGKDKDNDEMLNFKFLPSSCAP